MNVNEITMAKIAVNKSLLKEYDSNNERIVYLNDGNEFQIQLYNPKTEEIAAGIWINGEQLSNILIIRPGERIWLERYLDKAKKFKFTTYEVDNTVEGEKAIAKNGWVEIRFYDKRPDYGYLQIATTAYDSGIRLNSTDSTGGYTLKGISTPSLYSDTITTCLNSASSGLASTSCKLSSCVDSIIDNSALSKIATLNCELHNETRDLSLDFEEPVKIDSIIETGRISEGSYSSQEFDMTDKKFQSWAFKTEKIHILPTSQKPYTSNDLDKIYCTECGRKLKTKFKYCPFCGNKIDY